MDEDQAYAKREEEMRERARYEWDYYHQGEIGLNELITTLRKIVRSTPFPQITSTEKHPSH